MLGFRVGVLEASDPPSPEHTNDSDRLVTAKIVIPLALIKTVIIVVTILLILTTTSN